MYCKWTMLHPRMTTARLGFIPGWLREDDPRSAQEQLNAGYVYGGFQPFGGFGMAPNGTLTYTGDPPLKPLAKAQLREETIYFYQHSWVGIQQKDGSFVVARMD